jgi:hypothetical protein
LRFAINQFCGITFESFVYSWSSSILLILETQKPTEAQLSIRMNSINHIILDTNAIRYLIRDFNIKTIKDTNKLFYELNNYALANNSKFYSSYDIIFELIKYLNHTDKDYKLECRLGFYLIVLLSSEVNAAKITIKKASIINSFIGICSIKLNGISKKRNNCIDVLTGIPRSRKFNAV